MPKTEVNIFITDQNGENGKSIYRYKSFSFSQDVDAVVDTFTVTMIDPEFEIKVGYYLYFTINRELIIRGLIQKRDISISKTSTSVTISGKAATLLLVEQYCRKFNDFSWKTPKFMVDSLINQTNFIAKQNTIPSIAFSSDADNTEDEGDFETTAFIQAKNDSFRRSNQVIYDPDFEALGAYKEFSLNVGDTVWSKISEIVTINGFQTYFKPIGDLVIAKLKKDRDNAGVNFNIIHKNRNINNNVLTASLSEDVSNRYTELQVMTQLESGVNRTVKILDQTAPIEKLQVFSVANDQDPEKIGIEAREQQRTDGYQVEYTVSGFTQGQRIWSVNRWVHIEDEFLNIRQNLVIQKRVFNFSLSEGAKTTITLSLEKNLVDKIYPPETVPGVSVES